MTEEDYCVACDLARVRACLAIFHDMNAIEGLISSRNETYTWLKKYESQLAERIEVE